MSKKILVTGGLGFIGAALANRLADDGHKVFILDDGSRGDTRRLVEPGRFTVRNGDVRRASFGTSFDAVFHAAAVNGTVNFYKKPYEVLDVQLAGTLNVVNECRARGVRELVLFSSSEVYQTPPKIPTDEGVPLGVPDPMNPRYSYAAGKIASELLALHSGIERALVVRPHNVYGPDMGFEHVVPEFIARMARLPEKAEDGGPPWFEIKSDGETTRSFVFVSDFIEALMVAWEKGEARGVYHLGTEEQVTIGHLAAQVSRIFKRTFVRWRQAPPAAGGTRKRCPDTSKIRALGWAPRVTLSEGLAATADWYLSHRELWPTEEA